MGAQQVLQELDRQRLARLAPVLVDGESPVVMVPAQSVMLAERFGRGAGEGVLHLTSARLVFIDDRVVPAFQIPLEDVTAVDTSWIIMPGMRALHIRCEGDTSTFWTGKRFSRLMASAVALSPHRGGPGN